MEAEKVGKICFPFLTYKKKQIGKDSHWFQKLEGLKVRFSNVLKYLRYRSVPGGILKRSTWATRYLKPIDLKSPIDIKLPNQAEKPLPLIDNTGHKKINGTKHLTYLGTLQNPSRHLATSGPEWPEKKFRQLNNMIFQCLVNQFKLKASFDFF